MKVWAPQKIWVEQPDAELDQPNPVQNTWYPILEAHGGVRMYAVRCRVLDTNETLEIRITRDGQVWSSSDVFTANQWCCYEKTWQIGILNRVVGGTMILGDTFLECRSLKVELRKTSASGNGNLQGTVYYAKLG